MQETEGDGEEESRGDRKKEGRKLGRNKRQEEERQGGNTGGKDIKMIHNTSCVAV